MTETSPRKLSDAEQKLSVAKDGLMAVALLTGAASGVQGARLAKQATDGAVPVETGTQPASETPQAAARIQRTLGVLGTLNIMSGIALVAVNGVLAQIKQPSGETACADARLTSQPPPQPSVGRFRGGHGRSGD